MNIPVFPSMTWIVIGFSLFCFYKKITGKATPNLVFCCTYWFLSLKSWKFRHTLMNQLNIWFNKLKILCEVFNIMMHIFFGIWSSFLAAIPIQGRGVPLSLCSFLQTRNHQWFLGFVIHRALMLLTILSGFPWTFSAQKWQWKVGCEISSYSSSH